MEQSIRNDIIDAIKSNRIVLKDQGEYPGAHSEPFFYKTVYGSEFVLLRAREKRFADGYRKQQLLYPFLKQQNLPAHTARELVMLEVDDEIYAVMERFFGHGHNPERFAKATKGQQGRFVSQVAAFFFKLHSIPTEYLPEGLDYEPYFRYVKDAYGGDDVFLHADFNYSNFLVDDDYNLHAVFDWHPACIGPRVAEFAAFVYCNDPAFLPLILEAYNSLAGTSILPEDVIRHNSERN